MSQIHQGCHLPNKLEAVQQPPNKLRASTTKQAISSAPPNSTTSNPSRNTHGNPKMRKKVSVKSETLNASRNASRHREALRFAERQSSMHGPMG